MFGYITTSYSSLPGEVPYIFCVSAVVCRFLSKYRSRLLSEVCLLKCRSRLLVERRRRLLPVEVPFAPTLRGLPVEVSFASARSAMPQGPGDGHGERDRRRPLLQRLRAPHDDEPGGRRGGEEGGLRGRQRRRVLSSLRPARLLRRAGPLSRSQVAQELLQLR